MRGALIWNPLAVAGLANLLQQPRARRKRRKEARSLSRVRCLRPTSRHEGGIVNCCSVATLPTRVHGVKVNRFHGGQLIPLTYLDGDSDPFYLDDNYGNSVSMGQCCQVPKARPEPRLGRV